MQKRLLGIMRVPVFFLVLGLIMAGYENLASNDVSSVQPTINFFFFSHLNVVSKWVILTHGLPLWTEIS
jgi:hypothetical protein